MPPSTDPSFNADSAPDDLRASIMAAYEGEPEPSDPTPETADVATPADPAAGAAATDPLPEEEVAPTIKTDHPTDPKRYADGSFKPTKAATEVAPASIPSKDTQTQATPAAQPAVAPPAGWTAAEKAEWSKLSPVAQAAVSRREAEIANGGKQWSDEKRRYESTLAPIAEASRKRGLSTEQGTQLLISAQNALDANPVEGIRRIMATYGVTAEHLTGNPAANGSPETPQQPDIAALVRQAVQPMLAPIQQRYEADAAREQQQTVDFVTQFATSPGHEHFEAAQQEIMAMIPAIKELNPTWGNDKVLQEAYDRATFANPTTRAALMAAQEAEKEAKRTEAAKQRTNAAKRAGVSVTGAPSGAPTTQAKDSLRAELEAAFAG